jgi:hypothetical protein
MFALQDLLLDGRAENVSAPLGLQTNIRYVRTHGFPWLGLPPLYLTFRFETAECIELRRVVTEQDVRSGLLFYDG